MTAPLAFLLMLLAPSPRNSNWVLLERTDQYVTYVDSSSLKTVVPGMVELRSKQTFAREQFDRQNHYKGSVGKSASLQRIVPQPGWRLEFPWEATIRMACRSTT